MKRLCLHALGKLAAFHISDWRIPTEDLVLDRETMGQGCIPLATITEWIEETGYNGFVEAEIFSTRYSQEGQSAFLSRIIES